MRLARIEIHDSVGLAHDNFPLMNKQDGNSRVVTFGDNPPYLAADGFLCVATKSRRDRTTLGKDRAEQGQQQSLHNMDKRQLHLCVDIRKLSVRKGAAGNPARLYKLQVGLSAHA